MLWWIPAWQTCSVYAWFVCTCYIAILLRPCCSIDNITSLQRSIIHVSGQNHNWSMLPKILQVAWYDMWNTRKSDQHDWLGSEENINLFTVDGTLSFWGIQVIESFSQKVTCLFISSSIDVNLFLFLSVPFILIVLIVSHSNQLYKIKPCACYEEGKSCPASCISVSINEMQLPLRSYKYTVMDASCCSEGDKQQ